MLKRPLGLPPSTEILGAEIQYFRMDPRYWEDAIKRFKDAGLRCVTSYFQWGTHVVGQPDAANPAGVLDFEGRTDPRLNAKGFLDLVEKHGLNLNFRAGPFCCNEMVHGGYPSWLVLGDPSLAVWDWQNRTTQGYWIGRREGSQPSYLHPVYLDWCRKWFAAVDRELLVPHLRANGGCVTMVNLDNEISYIVKDSFLDSDYNPVNTARGGLWHRFLIERYGTAAQLPYDTHYAVIEDVPPPRSVPEVIRRDQAWYFDWIRFKTWVMTRYIRELRTMHEAEGVHGVTFMTNFNPHLPEGVPTRMPDFAEAVGEGGIVGYDFYRGAFMSWSGYHSMARVLKLMNSSVGYTWSAEFMAGTWNKDLSKASRVSDEHMRFMARCALAHGCKTIDWFMFHDRDCWGDAPLSCRAQPRPQLEVLRETARLLRESIPAWEALVPQTDAAIIYDVAAHQHTAIGDPQPCNDNDNHVGKPLIAGEQAGKASVEYYGLFRLVEGVGWQAAAVDLAFSDAALAGQRLAFLPGSPVISRVVAERLATWVAQGGHLVVSGAWPKCDENGKPISLLDIGIPTSGTTTACGRGSVTWHVIGLGQAKAEQETPADLAVVDGHLTSAVGHAHAHVELAEPLAWVDWAEGGGHREYRTHVTLASAIVQATPGSRVLFVLNHYPDAARLRITLGESAVRAVDLMDGTVHAIAHDRLELDIDRKSAGIFRLE